MTDEKTTRPTPLAVQGLNHWFGAGEARKQALFDINLHFEPGTLNILMGPSGSGKTTLLTLMGTLRRVEDGSVILLGQELAGADNAALTRARRRLGFIFQAHNLHDSLTARQNVQMGLDVHNLPDDQAGRQAVDHVLGLVGLEERLDYLPGNLSGGQKQRVAIARALVGNPDILLADEPTAALDATTGRQVVDMLKTLGLRRGTTTVMVTHDNRILNLADRIITLEDGRLTHDTAAPVNR